MCAKNVDEHNEAGTNKSCNQERATPSKFFILFVIVLGVLVLVFKVLDWYYYINFATLFLLYYYCYCCYATFLLAYNEISFV